MCFKEFSEGIPPTRLHGPSQKLFFFLYLELLNLHLVQDQNREFGEIYCVWYVLEVQCLGFSGI